MRNRNSFRRDVCFRSYCDALTIRGTARQIKERWEALGDEAEKAGDRVTAERFKQQAEHYLKLDLGLV